MDRSLSSEETAGAADSAGEAPPGSVLAGASEAGADALGEGVVVPPAQPVSKAASISTARTKARVLLFFFIFIPPV